MRLAFAAQARRNIDSIVDTIASDNPKAAEKVYRTIMTTASRLRDFPEMGHAGRVPGTREFSVPSLPYLIVYRGEVDGVTILAVFHGARDLARLFRQMDPRWD